jgi:hypothetical protein
MRTLSTTQGRRAVGLGLALVAAARLPAARAQPTPPETVDRAALPYEIAEGRRLRLAGAREQSVVLRDVQPADARNPTWVTVIVTPGPVPPAQRQDMGKRALATTGIYRLTAPASDGEPRTVHGLPALLFRGRGTWNNTGAPARLLGLAVFHPERVFFVFVGGTPAEMDALDAEVAAVLASFRPRAT